MLVTIPELKRWSALDVLTGKVQDLSDEQFSEGVTNKFIELDGKHITVENSHKIWIDGVIIK